MSWLIITLVLLVAFGPVLWLLPTKRDKRLAALRQRAMGAGLTVDVARLPKQNPAPEERVSAGGKVQEPVVEAMAYGRSLARRLKRLPGWRVLRAGSGREALPGWAFDPDPGAPEHLRASLEVLRPLLAAVPADVVGFEVAPQRVAAFWLEGPDATPETAERLAQLLQRAERDLLVLDERLESLAAGDDS